jgi:hypothetical protein
MNARAIGLLLASLYLGASGLLPGMAWGQSNAVPSAELDAKPIGKVVTATGSVKIEHTSAVLVQANVSNSGIGRVKADDPVYRGDIIQTQADGALGIVFTDGSTFNISSNARMELNEFVYDPNSHSNSTLFNLSKGSFTFLAGQVSKTGSMKVGTPVGTMGIRGTAPHVEILDDGTVKFSTLIEENKSANEKSKTGPRRRQAQDLSTPETRAAQQAEKELDKKFQICRGC